MKTHAFTGILAKAVVISTAIAISAINITPAGAVEKFVLATAMPEGHIHDSTMKKFMELLAQKSGGEMAADYHPGGVLGDWVSLFEQASTGAIQTTVTWGASEIDKRLDISFLSYVVDDWKKGAKVFGPDGLMFGVYEDILKDNNLVLLGVVPTGFAGIAIRKGVGKVPVDFPADGKGIKMRVIPAPIGVKRFETWGFSPVPMPYSELYTALQLGTIDARSFGPPNEIWQMRDVLETYVLTRDYFDLTFFVANLDWWNSLTDQQRDDVRAAAEETVAWSWGEAERIEATSLDDIREYGIKVVELSSEQLANAKQELYETEWPWMDEQIGRGLMNKIRAAAGIQ